MAQCGPWQNVDGSWRPTEGYKQGLNKVVPSLVSTVSEMVFKRKKEQQNNLKETHT